jgi:hypothetical protein
MAEGNTAYLEDRQGRCVGLRATTRLILIVVGHIPARSAASLLNGYNADER